MRKWVLAGIAMAVLLTGWHPVPKEPEGMALVRVLGVDGPGPVTLTAVCGGEDQEGNQSRGQCTGADFEEALSAVRWSGGEELSVTSVTWLVIGREVELENVLLAALRNEELGASATVWLAEGGAAELLGSCADPASALELLERQGIKAPTVVEALAALYQGNELCLPLLTEKGGEAVSEGAWTVARASAGPRSGPQTSPSRRESDRAP